MTIFDLKREGICFQNWKKSFQLILVVYKCRESFVQKPTQHLLGDDFIIEVQHNFLFCDHFTYEASPPLTSTTQD